MRRREFLGGLAGVGASLSTCGCGLRPHPAPVLRLAQIGDPQFGFGHPCGDPAAAYRADLARFERACDALSACSPDVVVLSGDLVNRAEDLARDWPRLLAALPAPCVVTPGNHDLGNRLTRENLLRFRRVVGPDYTSCEVKGWRILAGNSQHWFPHDVTDEAARYADWVQAERARASSAGSRLILATHYPPFELYLGEADSPRNRPLAASRVDSVEGWVAAGARFWLAGHTHTMLARAHRGLVLLNAETTGRNFDARPFGFRLLTVFDDDSWTWDFVPVGEEPN